MEPRPWTIGVLSTAYDLEEERKAIIEELKGKGIAVSAFELPEFPAESDMHSHDSCLMALDRVDIAILIINKRNGGQYYKNKTTGSTKSITEQECVNAIEAGIPVFTFVSKKAWDERHTYKQQFSAYIAEKCPSRKPTKTKRKKLKLEFDRTRYKKCTYVDKISTIDFIDSIQYMYDSHGASNWINTYSTTDDLVERVVGKLKGYSRKLIERIVKSQRDALMNKHTSTAFSMTLGDVFASKYYVEPPFKVESGSFGSTACTLSESIHNAISSDKSVLIYGEAGYGKTTTLAKCFSEHVDKFLSNPSYDIPLLLSLKNKGSNYHFDIEKLINEELSVTENTSLNHQPYPYLDLSQIRTRFYCDGFDEMAEKLSIQDLDRIRQSTIFTRPLLLTCRHQFATRYLRDASFSDKFGIRVRIDGWSADTAKKYIEIYCNDGRIDAETKNSIYKSMDTGHDLQQVLDSPLLVTMFLWYVEKNRKPFSEITGVELFRNWINELATRERTKIKLGEVDSNTIVEIWAHAAWEVYLHKVKGESYGLKFDDLIDSLEKKFPDFKSHIIPSWFSTLFDCTNECIIGTFHEQFMEFLVASVLISACISKEEPFPDFLKMVMRPEINRYFRGIWAECSIKEKESVFSALSEQYTKNIGDTAQTAIASRVHAIYHIARLNSPQRKDCLERAFNAENHISVLLSLYFGAIKLGQTDREETFYDLLLNNSEYSSANRGYHLAYYSDTIVGDELPFHDDGCSDWKGTLKAFERHFSSNESGHYYLRRIDLITMKQLVETRKSVAPLTDEYLAAIKKKIDNPPYQNHAFNSKVKAEYESLLDTYKAFGSQ